MERGPKAVWGFAGADHFPENEGRGFVGRDAAVLLLPLFEVDALAA